MYHLSLMFGGMTKFLHIFHRFWTVRSCMQTWWQAQDLGLPVWYHDYMRRVEILRETETWERFGKDIIIVTYCKAACNSSCFPEFMSSALWLSISRWKTISPSCFLFHFLWPIEYTKVTFGSFLTLDFKKLCLLLLFLQILAYTMIKSLTGMLDNERYVAQSLPSDNQACKRPSQSSQFTAYPPVNQRWMRRPSWVEQNLVKISKTIQLTWKPMRNNKSLIFKLPRCVWVCVLFSNI